jgi:nitrogen fixation protein NifU and related proteins
MEAPDRVAITGTPGRGPCVALYLRLIGDVISEARFQTHGCGVSIACGSMFAEMIMDRAASDCLELTPEHLAEALDGVPGTKLHRPAPAVAAIKNALSDRGSSSSLEIRGFFRTRSCAKSPFVMAVPEYRL